MARELNLQHLIPNLTCQIAYVTNHLGNYDETHHWTDLCMPLARNMGDQRSIAVSLYSLGLAALSKGLHLEAYQSLSESAAMIRIMKDRRLLAMILAALGRAAYGAGIDDEVRSNLLEALKYCLDVHSSQAPIETFMQIAFILSRASDDWGRKRAIELYNLATRFSYVSQSRWLMDTTHLEIERSFSKLPVDDLQAHRRHSQVLEVWNTAAVLREELSVYGWVD